MELYHVHLVGNYDKLYKPNSEFVVDKDKFNNRIYKRIYNMNSTVETKRYQDIVNYLNTLCRRAGLGTFGNRINLGEILELTLSQGCTQENLIKMLEDAKKICFDEGINLREMAMEEYRKNNCPKVPSRLHSLYACSEEGIDFWLSQIRDNSIEVFKIEVLDTPFLSNEVLLPYEGLSYGEKIEASYQYFHPKKKDLDPLTNEYLIQGKVKILERIL